MFCNICESWNCRDGKYNTFCNKKIIEILNYKLPNEISEKIVNLSQQYELYNYNLFMGWRS